MVVTGGFMKRSMAAQKKKISDTKAAGAQKAGQNEQSEAQSVRDVGMVGQNGPAYFERLNSTVQRCHAALCGEGDAQAFLLGASKASALGMLSDQEVSKVLERVSADVALLDLEDDPDLALDEGSQADKPTLLAIPFAAADALKWLAWHNAWYAALWRSALGEKPVLTQSPGLPKTELLRPEVRQSLLEGARKKWLKVCSAGALGNRPQALFAAELLAEAAGAACRHVASRCVTPKGLDDAKTEWTNFEKALDRLQQLSVLHEDACENIKWLFWNAAWHAANLVAAEQQEEDEEDEDEEDDEELYGEDYPGVDEDPLSNLAHFLSHVVTCHRGDTDAYPKWKGLCLTNEHGAHDLLAASLAGFNAIRLSVPMPSSEDVLGGPTQVLIRTSHSLGMAMILDLSAWSARSRGGLEGLRTAVGRVAKAAGALGGAAGVLLPRTKYETAVSLLKELRSADSAVGPETCAAILRLDEAPQEEGEYSGTLQSALSEGEEGVLLNDGHVVFELFRRPNDEAKSPQQLLSAACKSNEVSGDESVPNSCARFGLKVPDHLVKQCRGLGHQWREELCARFDAAAESTTHGWFAQLEDSAGSLAACLDRRWDWPDPLASRIIWPHGRAPVATLIYLHGFTCDGGSYLCCEDYFCMEQRVPTNKDEEEEDEEEDDEETDDVIYLPFPGLKVVLPSAPLRPISCYNGAKITAWYDYKTDHDGKCEDEFDAATLEESTRRIHEILDQEIAALGGPERVFLGGASQGCAVALHAAMTYHGRIGGVIATQGHLLSYTKVPEEWSSCKTPVRIYHGLADETMPWEDWVSACYDPLRASGGDVKEVLDEGVDHGDEEAEGKWVRAFLADMWERSGLKLPNVEDDLESALFV